MSTKDGMCDDMRSVAFMHHWVEGYAWVGAYCGSLWSHPSSDEARNEQGSQTDDL